MKNDIVNVRVVIDNRRSKNINQFPIKLRLTYKGRRRYYGTGYDASLKEWRIIHGTDANGNLRKIKNEIARIEVEAKKCCDEISLFSFKLFENEFFDQKIRFQNVESSYNTSIAELKASNRYGTAANYQTSINKLKKFKQIITFEDVTVEFLQKFENWMLEKGKSITTVGIYLRPLRVIFNIARDSGVIRPEAYPFGKGNMLYPPVKARRKRSA